MGRLKPEALREEVHYFDGLIIHRPSAVYISYAALQLCNKYRPERLALK